MLFGAHCSTAGGLARALERAERIGADCCQLFVKNNMQWFARPLSPNELAGFAAARSSTRLAWVFGHAGYLINLAAPASARRDQSVESLTCELERAEALGLPFLVLHPGAHLGAGLVNGLRQVVRGLDEVCAVTKSCKVRIALENTAGQGTCLGAHLKDLAEIYHKVQRPERLALCLDTAHLWAAGYDLRTAAAWEKVVEEVDRLIGLKEIVAFHLNDSKAGLGARVDRHEHIGRGRIGLEAFRMIVNDPRFEHLPACLETPKSEDLHEDVENLAVLRSLCGAESKLRLKALRVGPNKKKGNAADRV
ncbi:MAG: deoxyribonuclease IV [Verrucomicrobiota bacterium]|nr:deoxyribonuclease IV [Limisphaera sp.]MDW8380535.1 deoxyribonuclease IV [Verrucomicrobiota bacterium]